jgi:hypothetical protein
VHLTDTECNTSPAVRLACGRHAQSVSAQSRRHRTRHQSRRRNVTNHRRASSPTCLSTGSWPRRHWMTLSTEIETRVLGLGLESRSCWTRTRVSHIWTGTRLVTCRTLTRFGLDRTWTRRISGYQARHRDVHFWLAENRRRSTAGSSNVLPYSRRVYNTQRTTSTRCTHRRSIVTTCRDAECLTCRTPWRRQMPG